MADKIDVLRSVSLFRALANRELERVAILADEVDLPAGKVLMQQGESGAEMFVLITGAARVDHDGRELKTLGPGSVVGEMALLSEGPRNSTVTLVEPAKVLVLAHREFHTLMEDVPEVRDCIVNEMARRLRELEADKPN